MQKIIIEYEIKADAAKQQVAGLESQMLSLSETRKQLITQLKELKKDEEANAEAIQKVSAQLSENKRVTADTAQAYKLLQNSISNQGKSLNAQRADLAILNRQYANFQVGIHGTAQEMEALRAKIDGLSGEIKGKEAGINQFFRNVGNYGSALSGGIMGGLQAIPQVAAAAFAAEAVIGVAKAAAEYAKELAKVRGEVERLSGATGAALDAQTAKVEAIKKTYGATQENLLQSANALSKQLGVSFDEALDLINKGFAAGGDTAGELLDNLREYPSALSKAKISAEELVSVITYGAREGLYNDKAIDAIKEGSLTMTATLTTASKAALRGIGIDGDAMQKKISDGKITTMDALREISQRVSKLDPQSKQFGDVLADVFRAAGEDAGMFVQHLHEVPKTMDAAVAAGGKYADSQLRMAKANEDFALATQRLFGDVSEGFVSIEATAKGFIAEGLNKAIDTVYSLYDAFVELYNGGLEVRVIFAAIGSVVNTAFEAVKLSIYTVINATKTLGQVWGAILTGDFGRIGTIIKEGAVTQANDVQAAGADIANSFVNGFDNAITSRLEKSETQRTAKVKEQAAARNFERAKEIQAQAAAAKAIEAYADGTIGAYEARITELQKKLKEASSGEAYNAIMAQIAAAERAIEQIKNPLSIKRIEQKPLTAKANMGKVVASNIQEEADAERRARETKISETEAMYARYLQVAEITYTGIMQLGEMEANKAGANEEKKLKIQKKYAIIGAGIQAAIVVINGLQAISKIQAQTGVLAPIPVALQIASTALQLTAIAANAAKFGGTVSASTGNAGSGVGSVSQGTANTDRQQASQQPLPQIVVKVEDINRVQNAVYEAKVISSI